MCPIVGEEIPFPQFHNHIIEYTAAIFSAVFENVVTPCGDYTEVAGVIIQTNHLGDVSWVYDIRSSAILAKQAVVCDGSRVCGDAY